MVPGAMRNSLRVPPSPPAAAQTSLTSQYSEPRPQPPNQIADVDSGRNIYSPQQPIREMTQQIIAALPLSRRRRATPAE